MGDSSGHNGNNMVSNNIPAETKPENGEEIKNFALFGDAIGKNHIKGGNPVSGSMRFCGASGIFR